MSDLQPLPPAAIEAARLRRIRDELTLIIEALEASAGLRKYQPKRQVSYIHGQAETTKKRKEKR